MAGRASQSGVTVGELVGSAEWTLVEAEMREALRGYRTQLTALDPFDPALERKTIVLTAKIKAIQALNRHFYATAGMEEVEGERTLDG